MRSDWSRLRDRVQVSNDVCPRRITFTALARRNEVDTGAAEAEPFRHHQTHTMKSTLPLLLSAALLLPLSAADEKPDAPRNADKPDAPREADKPAPPARERLAEAKENIGRQFQAAMAEAAELEKAGKKDEADARREKARAQAEAAKADLERAVKEQGDRPRREGEPKRESGDRRPDGAQPQELENKLRHVEQAIAHLREAGMPEPAEQLNQIANRLRAALRGEGDAPRDGAPRRGDPEAPRREEGRREEPRRPQSDIETLRREIQELREVVKQLAEKQGR